MNSLPFSTKNQTQHRPLSGKTIVITRASHQAETFKQALENLGARVMLLPTIMIAPILVCDEVTEKLTHINQYDWVIFTSSNGVEQTIGYLTQLQRSPAETLGLSKIAAVGPATQKTLLSHGIQANIVPKTYVANALFGALEAFEGSLSGKRLLLLQADIAKPDLKIQLESSGALVDALSIYQTLPAPQGTETEAVLKALQNNQVNMITFTSDSAVKHFKTQIQPLLETSPDILTPVQFAAIGPVTGKALLTHLGRVDLEADPHTIPALIKAIENNYSNRR